MPWQMYVYFIVGLAIAYWYQRQQGHPEREHHWRGQFFLLMVLAWMWPILLLAILVNRPDRPKQNVPPQEQVGPAKKGADQEVRR